MEERVTRLRRRLSVELTEDTKSPSTPSTPTKKRGGRLAKPQLDNIDENAPVNSPKRTTRRSMAKDVAETEEKPSTPARRSARVKSNTSITAEVTQGLQSLDSPRAKRATRRNSLAGSDTEAPATPLRQTRRTRKDSSSSIENQVTDVPKKMNKVAEDVILEEPSVQDSEEQDVRKENVNPNEKSNSVSPTTRKSPRLILKKNSPNINTAQNPVVIITPMDDVHSDKSNNSMNLSESVSPSTKKKSNKLSTSSEDLLNLLSDQSTKNKPMKDLNKSTSAISIPVSENSKRVRTKSLTYINCSPGTESNFLSDNETTIQNKRKNKKISDRKSIESSVIGDFKAKEENKQHTTKNSSDTYEIPIVEKKKKRASESSLISGTEKHCSYDKVVDNSFINTSISKKADKTLENTSVSDDTLDKSSSKLVKDDYRDIEREVDDQCVPVVSQNINTECDVFDVASSNDDSCEPMDIDETMPENISLVNSNSKRNSLSTSQHNESVKIKSSLLITETCDTSILNNSRKSRNSLSNSNNFNTDLNQSNKEKISMSEGFLDTRSNHSKSTLILSQSKNTSTDDNNKVQDLTNDADESRKSRKSSFTSSNNCGIDISNSNKQNMNSSLAHSITEDLENNQNRNTLSQINNVSTDKTSKSLSISHVCETKGKDKNLSLNNVPDNTPLKHKNIQKLGIQTSTPNLEKQDNTKIKNDHERNENSKNTNISTSDSDSSEKDNTGNLLIDEAQEASDDYESGDSQDEEERLYEKENEIIEKGETLSSTDQELSSDTDYEKDSFVVSSNEDDNELLSGSGDDLDMSDNELTMSAKSKQKYNERKKKEQKLASKEMFQARHNISNNSKTIDSTKAKKTNRNRIESNNSTETSNDELALPKKKRMRIESNHSMESSNDELTVPKKNNRQRIDSTMETTLLEEDKPKKKNRSRIDSTLEHSINQSVKSPKISDSIDNKCNNEKEITVCQRSLIEKDPLSSSVLVKTEPKTPQKDLNISTINFTTREEIEEVQVENDVSLMKNVENIDPLQDESEHSIDSATTNEEIVQNYNSVLNDLNNLQDKINIKSTDISLNLDKKSKKKKNKGIIDELNITHTKKRISKNDAELSETKSPTKEQSIGNKIVFDCDQNINIDSSSESIDLQLLFPGDSDTDNECGNPENDVDKECNAPENDNSDTGDNECGALVDDDTILDDGISLRKSIATTNIHESFDNSLSVTNESISKKKKYKVNDTSQLDLNTTPIENLANNSVANESLTKNKKRNSIVKLNSKNVSVENIADKSFSNESFVTKKKRNSVVELDSENITIQNFTNNSLNVTNESISKKKKNKVNDTKQDLNTTPIENLANGTNANESLTKNTKRNSIVEMDSQKIIKESAEVEVLYQNNAADNESSSKKQKKKKKSIEAMSGNLIDDVLKLLLPVENKKKKRKLSERDEEIKSGHPDVSLSGVLHDKKRKRSDNNVTEQDAAVVEVSSNVSGKNKPHNEEIDIEQNKNTGIIEENKKQKHRKSKKSKKSPQQDSEMKPEIPNKKRRRDSDEGTQQSQTKVLKGNFIDNVHVRRLPVDIIAKLGDKPNGNVGRTTNKRSKIISTTAFTVEEESNVKNKPSQYLEQSIHITDESKQRKGKNKKPKLLQFLPTASTSSLGFTTKFQVNVLPKEIKFEAQSNKLPNFKEDYLQGKRQQRTGNSNVYTKFRNVNLRKF